MSNARILASYASNFPSFRNRIINGDLSNPINQRGAGSITASTGYTYDRWYYDGTSLYQGIEDKNVNDGTYVISWQGSGFNAYWKLSTDTTANNGPDSTSGFSSALSSGDTFTVSGSGTGNHLWIKFSLDTALDFSTLDKVMVEEGTVPTPFEHRPYGMELSLCQRYYQKIIASKEYTLYGHGGSIAADLMEVTVNLPVSMRSTPSVNFLNVAFQYYPGTVSSISFATGETTQLLQLTATPTVSSGIACRALSNNTLNSYIEASAEL